LALSRCAGREKGWHGGRAEMRPLSRPLSRLMHRSKRPVRQSRAQFSGPNKGSTDSMLMEEAKHRLLVSATKTSGASLKYQSQSHAETGAIRSRKRIRWLRPRLQSFL